MYKNQPVEITLISGKTYDDPFSELEVAVNFKEPDDNIVSVPAFWAGGNTWKVRYGSDKIGVHSYSVEASDKSNTELNAISGAVEIEEYTGDNPLYLHGSVTRTDDNLYLSYRDGERFFWLGDTWWMGLTSRLRFPEDFETLTSDRKSKGFNVVQIVAGLYPDMEWYDERGANEAGYPWDKEFKSINPEYFDMADKRIIYLCENGITPCIVGCWGFFMKTAGKETLLKHWRYLIARYAAYPVAWCIAGEANMMFYDDTSVTQAEHLKKSRKDWNDVTAYVKRNDPFKRLISIHPTSVGHEQIEDESLLDVDFLQTGHGGYATFVNSMKQVRANVERHKLPVINDEVNYDGICGSNYDDVQRYVFITSILLGACGHTYGANGIWQVNGITQPYGVSPHGAAWGNRSWKEAAALQGSRDIGRCAAFLNRFDLSRFEYRPDWIEGPCSLNAADGNFAAGIPGEVRVFYKPYYGGGFWGVVRLLNIEQNVKYRFLRYNPLTDVCADLGVITQSNDGTWETPRADAFGDWLYALVKA
jgi:hypothetical protein